VINFSRRFFLIQNKFFARKADNKIGVYTLRETAGLYYRILWQWPGCFANENDGSSPQL
jgi:hypothetical protein